MELPSNTISGSDVSTTPKLFFIPREVRDMIYTDVLGNGHLEIMRVSRHLNAETSKLLSDHGIHRMTLDFPRLFTFLMDPRKIVEPKIQNVDVKVDIRIASELLERWPRCNASIFGKRDIKRKHCDVIIECNFLQEVPSLIWQALVSMGGFESVVVKLDIEMTDTLEEVAINLGAALPLDLDRLYCHHHKIIGQLLQKDLGKAVVRGSGLGLYIEFFPGSNLVPVGNLVRSDPVTRRYIFRIELADATRRDAD